MNGSIHEFFKVGIVLAMSFPYYNNTQGLGVIDCIHAIAVDDFFDAIELNPINDRSKISQVISFLEQSGLEPIYNAQGTVLASGVNPNHIDEKERLKAEQLLMNEVDNAFVIGSKRLSFLSGKWEPERKDASYKQLIKTTVNLCKYAKDKDILVQLEVFDFDIDKSSLVGPAPLAASFASEVRTNCSNFGLMVDLSHIPMCYETSEFVIRTLKPYISHLHFGNTVISDPADEAYGDEHPRFGFPNSKNDVDDLAEYFSVLKKEGFFNREQLFILSLEVKPRPYEDLNIVLTNTKRVIHRAWAKAK